MSLKNMLPILDAILGLVFLFLLFSLIVSALNELILSSLDKRAEFMEEALAELLADPTRSGGTLSKFLNHGLVDSLSRNASGKAGKPSYLPPKVFVSAVLDVVAAGRTSAPRTLGEVLAGIDAMTNTKLKESLIAIYNEAGHDLEAFKQGVEDWFNQGMERVSGWYKRYTQTWMFGLGVALAVACNVDALHVIQSLSSDPQLRSSVVEQAIRFATTHSTNEIAAPAANGTNVAGAVSDLNASALPVGWGPAQLAKLRDGGWIISVMGWLVTALAGTLGAPFWFDTLNRFINIRAAGRAPEEGDPTNPNRK